MHGTLKGCEKHEAEQNHGYDPSGTSWGKTQEKVANDLGITKSSWAMYERDERVPRDEVKIRIAKYFGKSVQEIFYTQFEHYKCS